MGDTGWNDRVCAHDGTWSGNIYDFFFQIHDKIVADVRKPFAIAKDGKPAETDLNFTIEQCIAWNKVVSNDLGTGNNWSSGAVIGVANIKNTMTDCYRRPDMTYKDGNRDYVLKDMENTSPSAPLAYDASLNFYAYHGKAAPEGSTISSVAKMLKWPETIWDLSGDSPKLK